jgi:hypothetical protein
LRTQAIAETWWFVLGGLKTTVAGLNACLANMVIKMYIRYLSSKTYSYLTSSILGAGRPKPALLFLWERKSKQKVHATDAFVTNYIIYFPRNPSHFVRGLLTKGHR